MLPQERAALDALLARMRSLQADLDGHNAGVCLLHIEAAITALESHIARGGASMIEELRHGLASSATTR